MRIFLSLFALLLVSWPAQAGGYGQQFVPQQQFAPAYVPQAQASFYKQQTIIQQQQFAPAYAPQAPACVPAQAAFYAPVQAAPVFRAPRQKGLGGRNVFRQRTIQRGNFGGVQAQFSSGY